MSDVVRTFWTLDRPDVGPLPRRLVDAATRMAEGTAARVADLDPLISASADHWRLSRMAIIDRAILRLAVYEFLHAPTTPRAVVIDEAIELARTFSTDEAVKFVNGVLDGIRKKLDEPPDPSTL